MRKIAVLIAALAAVTALWLVPYEWPGAWDARTGGRAAGFGTTLAQESLVLEPIFGPARAFVLSPDARSAVLSWVLWGLAAGVVFAAVSEIRRRRAGAGLRTRPLLARIAAPPGLVLLFLLALCMFPHIPGYRITTPGPEWVTADFHGHTWASDGFFSPSYTVRWHAANGFDAVAVVDPLTMAGAREAAAFASENPPLTVIVGEESRYALGGYFIALGIDEPIDIDSIKGVDNLAKKLHAKGAAVISCMTIPHRDRMNVTDLSEKGFDAFEIYNHGHQPLCCERAEWLDSRASSEKPALACVDWHGKSMGAKAWTAIRIPGWRDELDHAKRAAAIVGALREGKPEDFVPVTAGSPLPASTLRKVFDPFVTLGEYALGITFPQWLAWVAWILAVFAALRVLGRYFPGVPGWRLVLSGFCVICWALLSISGSLLLLNFAIHVPDSTMIAVLCVAFLSAGAAAAFAAVAFASDELGPCLNC